MAEALVALVTLTVLEIVLGIDNIVFISIMAGKLPAEQQARARRLGLAMALVTRVLLLLSLAWVVRLTDPLFAVLGFEISGRDLILIVGGLFLLGKSTHEIHQRLEGADNEHKAGRPAVTLSSVIIQIGLLDIIFSLDSVITAVGMAREIWVMIAAVVIAIGVMMLAAGRIERVRRRAPHRQDACAQLPAADWLLARGRGARGAHSEGLHLLCDGILRVRGDA